MVKVLNGVDPCICCGYRRRRVLEFQSRLLRLNPPVKVVKCKCGLIHIFPFCKLESSSKLYDELHSCWGSFCRSGEPEEYEKLRIGRIQEYLGKKELSLLEIGSGVGYFLNYAKRMGWGRIVGIEISMKAVEFAKKSGLNEIYCGDFLEVDLPPQKFDLIYCNHVLEHLPYPDRVLEKCRKFMKENSLLVMEVPYEFRNLGYFYYSLFRKKNLIEIYEKPVGHIYFFSPRTIKRLLRKSGFRIIKFSCFTRGTGRALKDVVKATLSLSTVAPSIEVWARR